VILIVTIIAFVLGIIFVMNMKRLFQAKMRKRMNKRADIEKSTLARIILAVVAFIILIVLANLVVRLVWELLVENGCKGSISQNPAWTVCQVSAARRIMPQSQLMISAPRRLRSLTSLSEGSRRPYVGLLGNGRKGRL
jgi:intracellular septation protein A